MRRTPSHNRLVCERLENRNLMAGNVNAIVNADGDLLIDGDAAGNIISVESAGAGSVQVRGFADAGGPTSVNRTPNGLQIFNNFSGDIFIRLRGGDDVVRVTNLVASGDVLLELGGGNDQAVTGRDTAGGNLRFGGTPSGPLFVQAGLRVLGGGGDDTVFQSDAHVQGVGVVNLGEGADTLRMDRPVGSGANVEYAGLLTVLPGNGNDTVDLIGLVVDDTMVIDDATGPANININSVDIHVNLTIVTDVAADSVAVRNTNVSNQLFVATVDGNDSVIISAIADRLVVDMGADQDTLTVSSSNTGRMHLQLGIGNDDLDLLSSRTDVVSAFGNDGDDVFLVRNTRAIDAFFYGEGGFDIYRESSALPNNITRLRRFTIERNERV